MNRRMSACVAAILVLGACSSSGSNDTSGATTAGPSSSSTSTTEATTTTTEAEAEDAVVTDPSVDCADAEAVGALLASEVDRSPSVSVTDGTDELSYTTEGCSYDLAEGAGSVSIARIKAESDEGDGFYLRLEARAESDAITDGFEPIADLGDDAYRDGTDIVVEYGERMMFVGFDSFGEVDDQELTDRVEVATLLAENLVPLDLDQEQARRCTSIEDVVNDTVGTVSDTATSGSGVVGDDDISITTEGCALDLQDGRELSVSVADSDQWDAWVEAKQSSTFTSNFVLTSLGELSAYDTGTSLVVNEGEQPLEVGTTDLDLDDAAAADLRVELARLALGR